MPKHQQAPHRPWTADEIAQLRATYEAAAGGGPLRLRELASRLGRCEANLPRKARALGLTNARRPKRAQPRLPLAGMRRGSDELRAHLSRKTKEQFARLGHPRGMLGKHHSPENVAKLRAGNRRYWAQMTADELADRNTRMIAARVARHGTGNNAVRGERMYSRAHAGRRTDLGNRFFRSRWEANYARYLNYLVSVSAIQSWEYEPQTFVFPGVTRGPRTYTPDFRVVTREGWVRFYEVKGWMDRRSLQQIDRFDQFFGLDHFLHVIGPEEYRDIRSPGLPHWELGDL